MIPVLSTAAPAGRMCPMCGQDTAHRNLLLHHECWQKLPPKLQQDFNRSPTIDDRRAAYRAILEHIRERKEQPELFPS